MFREYRPEPWHQRQIVDTAIRLVEDYVAWVDAHGARLATAGRDKDAAYARALRELGRDHLNLLHWRRHELLSRERLRERGRTASEAFLVGALRRWGRGGLH